MSSVAEIEKAITKLSPREFARLAHWFDEERHRKWDRELEADAASGKLHEAYKRLQSESQGHPETSLDQILDDEELP